MSRQVQAKFDCRSRIHDRASDGHRIKLDAVTRDGTPENDEFFEATPGGEIDLHLVSEATADFFEPGQTYLLTFTKA